MPEMTLDDLLAHAPGLSGSPETLVALVDVADDPTIDAERLIPIVERDPGLTAKLLKLCNSSKYGARREIGTVREALVRIGNQTFSRLAVSVSTQSLLYGDLETYGIQADDLWRHSVAVGYSSSVLVKDLGLPDHAGRAFTAGLLHEIGKVVINGVRKGDALPGRGPERPREVEAMGMDHGGLGSQLLQVWGLPAEIVEAIRLHHEPVQARQVGGIAAAVASANHLVEQVGDGQYVGIDDEEAVAVATQLGCSVECLHELLGTLHAELDDTMSLAMAS